MYIIVYSTDQDGRLKSPLSYDFQAMINSDKPSQYGKIYELYNQYKDEMFKKDFMVSCDNVDFHQFSYNIVLDCAWLAQPNKQAIKEDFKAKMAEFDLGKIIAPEISIETMQLLVDGKLPNRYATKNQQPAQPATGQAQVPISQVMQAPISVSGSSTFVTAQPASSAPVVAAPSGGATKSDLDILNELG
jgi:hypothetical protein